MNAAIRTAALSLLSVFNNYGLSMKDESLTSESSLINSLLADLATPAALANIALLPQCDTYIAALQTAQTRITSYNVCYTKLLLIDPGVGIGKNLICST